MSRMLQRSTVKKTFITCGVPEQPAWSVVGVADFNRDGHPDYLLYNGRNPTDGDMVS